MPLEYNPKDKSEETGRRERKPGRYKFKVDDITEKTFNSGNKGLNVKLLVDDGGSTDATCYCNFVYTDKALWRLEEFLDAVGLSFDPPPEIWEIDKKEGVAEFAINEKGYYEAKKFLVEGATKKTGAHKGVTTKDVDAIGDVPF
jgi:hypothetical protein